MIVLPKFDLVTITIEQIIILQDALTKKNHQEILERELRKKKELQDVKDVFLDALILLAPKEHKPIMEQLVNIVKQINDANLDSNVE